MSVWRGTRTNAKNFDMIRSTEKFCDSISLYCSLNDEYKTPLPPYKLHYCCWWWCYQYQWHRSHQDQQNENNFESIKTITSIASQTNQYNGAKKNNKQTVTFNFSSPSKNLGIDSNNAIYWINTSLPIRPIVMKVKNENFQWFICVMFVSWRVASEIFFSSVD